MSILIVRDIMEVILVVTLVSTTIVKEYFPEANSLSESSMRASLGETRRVFLYRKSVSVGENFVCITWSFIWMERLIILLVIVTKSWSGGWTTYTPLDKMCPFSSIKWKQEKRTGTKKNNMEKRKTWKWRKFNLY